MRLKAALLLPAAAGILLLLAAAEGGLGARPAATTSVERSFASRALRSRVHYIVHLPAGYAKSHERYPVVYFLHGLPAGPTAYRTVSWVGDALDRTGRKAILVVPQGTRKANGDPEYHDWGPGHNWETALAVELPANVDASFRTIRSRRGRAIVGTSAGGYGASALGLHHPVRFSVIESWSGYFRPTDPTGETTLDVGSDADNAYASVHSLVLGLGHRLARYPTYLGFYVGASDRRFVADNVQLNRELNTARIAHAFAIYPGAHTTSLWQRHAVAWLRIALRRLSPPVAG